MFSGARIIAALSLLACSAGAGADDRLQRNAEQLEKLRGRIQALERSLESDRSKQDELRTALEDSERRYTELGATLGALREQIAQQSARRRRTEQQRREADALLQRHKRSLARQVRASYMIGQRGQTKLALNQDGGQRVSLVMTYYDYLNRARAKRIEKILDQVQTLAALSEKLRRETAELDVTRSRHEGTLAALEALRAERQDMVERLRERIVGGEEELQQLQADERQLTRLLRELRKTLADIPVHLGAKPFTRSKGRLPWPLKGRLLADYGQLKSGTRLRWNGLWIAGPEGASVKAIAPGRVAGGVHRVESDFGHPYGFDITHIASYTTESIPSLRVIGSLDAAYERSDAYYAAAIGAKDETYWVAYAVPGLQFRVNERVDLIGEVGVGLNDDSNDYVAVGLSFYFTSEPVPYPR
jgi:septal ring factor EnvC (AmiA/AmiB activator)